ncbi:PREDICTED: uncharacterized protein LOC104611760 [Nelumbo nucifera]|uniref:Uncharacterized protein LOC104611760 n=1 Tax=Nelumbo nucifera TaxID=4432 RepID=A0A1U8B860_NELNU|nr:PREDICTED: uncharacterized protein LOC104611760 [Nelumbo nucifera]
MTDSSAINENRYHVRSISMPSNSHPTTTRIEEELSRLRALELSIVSGSPLKAESICVALLGLVELYKCVENFLQMPQTRPIQVHHQPEGWVVELIEGSVTLLDIGGIARDIFLQMKENVKHLQSALGRRKFEEKVLGNMVASYTSFKKRAKNVSERLVSQAPCSMLIMNMEFVSEEAKVITSERLGENVSNLIFGRDKIDSKPSCKNQIPEKNGSQPQHAESEHETQDWQQDRWN